MLAWLVVVRDIAKVLIMGRHSVAHFVGKVYKIISVEFQFIFITSLA